MNRLELTFPVFYHCAIKGACSLQQYNCVNLLLCGKMKSDNGISISETTASVYVNGIKPLPKDLIFDLLHLPADEVIRRLRELNFFDVSAIAAALERLLDVVLISPSTKGKLLTLSNTPNMEYQFICEVFLTAIKNPASNTKRLSKAEKDIIKACRNNEDFRPMSESVNHDGATEEGDNPSDGQQYKTDASADHDTEPDAASSPSHFKKMFCVHKWVARSEAERKDMLDFCISKITAKSGVIDLDDADIASVLPDNDDAYAVLLKCEGDIGEVVPYIEHSCDFSKATSVLLSVRGSTEISSSDADTIVKLFEDKYSSDIPFLFGLCFDEDISPGDVCLYTLFSIPVNDQTPENRNEEPLHASTDKDVRGGEADETDQFPLNLFKQQ